ncbi:MAG: FIST C-terminal domain-containing protein [Pseudomonadota bacterium]
MRSALSRASHWRDAVEDCLRQIGPCGDANLGFVYFSDHFADDAQRLLDHLRAGSGVANDLLSGGISGVAFSREVDVASRLTQGRSPVAGPFPITECEGNVVVRLGGRPALAVYLEAAGNPPAGDLRRVAATLLVGLQRPRDDPHDYLVRHVIGIDPHNGLLAVSERVEAGQSMLLCRRDATAARQDMLRMLTGPKQSLAAPPWVRCPSPAFSPRGKSPMTASTATRAC